MRAALYLRQSLDLTGQELGIERQEAECRRVARERGYEVTTVITDNNRSASKGERPGYIELLDKIERRTLDVVVVLRLDRLLRRPIELEWLIDLCERTGVAVVTVDGMVDLTTSAGRQVARLQAAFARWEMEVKSERHVLANAQKAVAGKPHGTGRCYGYMADGMNLNENEAAVLRHMAKMVLAGETYLQIATWANANGHVTAKGNPWRSVNVRNRLLNKRYAGIRFYKGVEYRGQWTPIFDEETWLRLQHVMKTRSERVPFVPRPRSYLLTGLAYCGKCGGKMIGSVSYDRPGHAPRRSYTCPSGNKHLNRNADGLEHFIVELVIWRLTTPELGKLITQDRPQYKELKQLLEDRRDQQARLDELVDDYASGLLDARQLERAKNTANSRLLWLDQEIERLNRDISGLGLMPIDGTIRDAWNANMNLRWRQALLKLLLKRIIVMPGMTMPKYTLPDGRVTRFDPSLIECEWIA